MALDKSKLLLLGVGEILIAIPGLSSLLQDGLLHSLELQELFSAGATLCGCIALLMAAVCSDKIQKLNRIYVSIITLALLFTGLISLGGYIGMRHTSIAHIDSQVYVLPTPIPSQWKDESESKNPLEYFRITDETEKEDILYEYRWRGALTIVILLSTYVSIFICFAGCYGLLTMKIAN